jgi:hypothetical protein
MMLQKLSKSHFLNKAVLWFFKNSIVSFLYKHLLQQAFFKGLRLVNLLFSILASILDKELAIFFVLYLREWNTNHWKILIKINLANLLLQIFQNILLGIISR